MKNKPQKALIGWILITEFGTLGKKCASDLECFSEVYNSVCDGNKCICNEKSHQVNNECVSKKGKTVCSP